jgi:thiol-disulfide isomerase/thioredoxin
MLNRSRMRVVGALAFVCTSAVIASAQTSPARLLYPSSDASADIAAALIAAKADGKHVLLDFGADWCPDCRVLGSLMESETVKPFLQANYHVVHIDVGRRDKNLDVATRYHATADAWIPAVVVLDAAGTAVAITDDKVRLTRRSTASDLLALLEGWAPKKPWRALSTFTEHGVKVDLALEKDSTGRVWLTGAYTPTERDAHLYSKDLPANGIGGLGRPTILALIAPSALRATGSVVANRPVEGDRIDVLNVTLPVYPDGPVTLRVPVDLPPAGSATRAVVSISYMACGPKGCLPPVEDKRVTIDVR